MEKKIRETDGQPNEDWRSHWWHREFRTLYFRAETIARDHLGAKADTCVELLPTLLAITATRLQPRYLDPEREKEGH